LTLAFERLGKARGISGWLGATPTAVMSVTYKKAPLAPHEIATLTAFLQQASTAGTAAAPGRTKFLAMAAGCTLLAFVVIGGAWRNRLRGVRERLTAKRGER
jgi:hypothetical protein